MKRVIRKFNMIEVLLALAVVSIAMVAILAVLVPTLQASSDATRDNAAQNAASNVIAMLTTYSEMNWSGLTGLAVKNEKIEDGSDNFTPTTAECKKAGASDSFGLYKVKPGLFSYLDTSFAVEEEDEGVTTSKSVPLVNIKISYKTISGLYYYNDSNYTSIASPDVSDAKRFYVELSWPTYLPYNSVKRERRYFVLDLYKK